MTRPLAAILAVALPVTLASAQNYDFTVSSKASAVDTSFSLVMPLVGSFIGNFNAESNPGGTLTRPGLFGGSGNNPIPYTATLDIGTDLTTPPSGGFLLSIDLEASTVEVSGLDLDLLGGDTLDVGGTLTILYRNFNTQQPSAIFPGGVALPLPLPTVAQIESLTAIQSGPGLGALVEDAPGVYSLTALVPIDLVAQLVVQGEPVGEATTLPAVLPLVGTLDLASSPPTLTAGAKSAAEQELPLEPPLAFADAPVPVPTLLPPGSTANLLFGGEIATISVEFSSSVALTAVGTLVCVPADLNCDGQVNGADLGILLAAWGERGPADLNGDGVVDGSDLGILLGAWTG